MENFKLFTDIECIDERHILLSLVSGRIQDKVQRYDSIKSIVLNNCVPDEIKSQFNVLRNLALYQYFCYSFSSLVQHQSFVVIEYALRIRFSYSAHARLKNILRKTIEDGFIKDSGFRHIDNPSPNNEYSKSLIDIIPDMRNEFAHGTNQLTPQIMHYIQVCADFINQLYPENIQSS